jgi:hypothetical protein
MTSTDAPSVTDEHHRGLRAWAKGTYTMEAATELLIRAFRGRFARPGNRWIETDNGRPWIDFEAIEDNLGGLSGGERRFLLLAASLGDGGVDVQLGDIIPGLDRELLALVLAAIAHAGGSHQHTGFRFDDDGRPLTRFPHDSLYNWPTSNTD